MLEFISGWLKITFVLFWLCIAFVFIKAGCEEIRKNAKTQDKAAVICDPYVLRSQYEDRGQTFFVCATSDGGTEIKSEK